MSKYEHVKTANAVEETRGTPRFDERSALAVRIVLPTIDTRVVIYGRRPMYIYTSGVTAVNAHPPKFT